MQILVHCIYMKIIFISVAAVILFGVGAWLYIEKNLFSFHNNFANTTILDQTSDYTPNSFTISPDGKWLIYLARDENVTQDYYAVTHLAVLNLTNQTKKLISITTDQATAFQISGYSCWSQNSRYCVFPSLAANAIERSYPRYIIDVSNPDTITLVANTTKRYSDIEPSELFTCSDCMNSALILNLQSMLSIYQIHPLINPTEIGSLGFEPKAYISPDKSRIYYVEEDKSSSSLIEFDTQSHNKRILKTINSSLFKSCPKIADIALSPNQKYLAYQVSSGCTWVSTPSLYMYDLKTHKETKLADHVYSAVHWHPDARRIFFYWCENAGGCNAGKSHIQSISIPVSDTVNPI